MDPSGAAPTADETVAVSVEVNGERHERSVEPRMLLSDFLRHELELTGTHVGCEHGVCGACTILLDGAPVRSFLIFAVQVDGHAVRTVESLAPDGGPGSAPGLAGDGEGDTTLHPLQAAFREEHGLQCGFCTPGILMAVLPFLEEHPDPSEEEVRELLSGHLCRCTGYQFIVDAVLTAAERMRDGGRAAS